MATQWDCERTPKQRLRNLPCQAVTGRVFYQHGDERADPPRIQKSVLLLNDVLDVFPG